MREGGGGERQRPNDSNGVSGHGVCYCNAPKALQLTWQVVRLLEEMDSLLHH